MDKPREELRLRSRSNGKPLESLKRKVSGVCAGKVRRDAKASWRYRLRTFVIRAMKRFCQIMCTPLSTYRHTGEFASHHLPSKWKSHLTDY